MSKQYHNFSDFAGILCYGQTNQFKLTKQQKMDGYMRERYRGRGGYDRLICMENGIEKKHWIGREWRPRDMESRQNPFLFLPEYNTTRNWFPRQETREMRQKILPKD